MTNLYDVVINLEAPEGAETIAGLLTSVFSGSDTASVARPSSVAVAGNEVVVRFSDIAAEVPAHGEEYVPPREDEPSERPGREAIDMVSQVPADVLVPALRALVALSAARVRAGLSPRQSLTLHVEPTPVHPQDELRHDHT